MNTSFNEGKLNGKIEALSSKIVKNNMITYASLSSLKTGLISIASNMSQGEKRAITISPTFTDSIFISGTKLTGFMQIISDSAYFVLDLMDSYGKYYTITYSNGSWIFDSISDRISTLNIGSISTLSAFNTALHSALSGMSTGAIKPFIVNFTASFTPFNTTGGFSGYIQGRNNTPPTSSIIQLYNESGIWYQAYDNNGTITWSSVSDQMAPLTTGKTWTDFTQPTLQNGSHYGSKGCQYAKFGCFVVVIISVQFDSAPSNQLLWTMPSGYIPIGDVDISASGGGAYNAKAQCVINSSGGVRVTSVDRWVTGYGIYVVAAQ